MPFASRLETQQVLIANSLTLAQAVTPEATTLSNPAFNFSALSTLNPGGQGPEVKQLQTTLKALGYYNGTIDGVYGESTVTAVSKFQQAMGLTADGVAGSTTIQRLEAAIAQQKQLSSAPQTETQPETTPTVESEQRSWVIWLLGVLAIAGIGTGLLYLLQRRTQAPKHPTAIPAAFETPGVAEPTMSDAEPVDTPMLNGVNGHSTVISEANDSSSAPLTVGETTRLSRINIVDELVKELRSPDPAKRRKAIWELGQRGDTQAVQPLVDLMIDSDSKQRSLILASLSEIGVRTLKPMNRALAISLQDENPEVRKNAIRDVTRIYDLVAQISQLLRHATEDPDAEVQETARWALNQVNRIRTAATMDMPSLKNSVSPPESLPERFPENMEH